MGAFTTPPDFTEASDVGPENAFDVELFTTQVVKSLRDQGAIPPFGRGGGGGGGGWGESQAEWLFRILGHLATDAPFILQHIIEAVAGMASGPLKALVLLATGLLKPGMGVLAELTNAYVNVMVGEGLTRTRGGLPIPAGPARDSTEQVFDKIMAPMLNLLTPSNPGAAGSGNANAQHILGTLISIHLSTWMVNIISNWTGIGALKFINSFDDALLSGISARGFSRLASKPYLQKYVVTPLEKDLNRQWPVDIYGPSTLVKSYIRGAIDRETLIRKLRERGWSEEVVEDILLDSIKLLSVGVLGTMVKKSFWTDEQAIRHLQQQGYTRDFAETLLWLEVNELVFAQERSLASSLTDAFIDRRIDNPTLRSMLQSAGFTQAEVNAFSTRGAILQEIPRRLSLGQVRALFQESLVDLDYVMGFLREENYRDDDIDLLVLLEFTVKEEREQRRKDLLERRRIALEAQLGFEEEADRARLAELQALGGPTP